MQLKSHTRRSAETDASAQQTYRLLADVPRSVRHFPELDSITQEGEAWVWRMRKLGAGPVTFQVVYAARYGFDASTRAVTWESVPGFGNTRVSGRWIIEPAGAGSRFTLDTSFVLDAPFPGFLQGTATALMARENDRLIAGYLANLKATLDREARSD